MGDNIKDNGKIIECMVKEFINGKMEENIKEIGKMENKMGKEHKFILMELKN